jgi:hypothetical protein
VISTSKTVDMWVLAVLVIVGLVAPMFVYPVFLMKVLCFALFACAFNLLVGYVGLLSRTLRVISRRSAPCSCRSAFRSSAGRGSRFRCRR